VRIALAKITDQRHRVTVHRDDGSDETVELDTRSFLRHDLAHYAVAVELGLGHGVWGSVAAGGSLSGDGLDGADMMLSESLAGPMQTMMRTGGSVAEIRVVIDRVAPDLDTDIDDLSEALHDRLRRLAGHWAATAFGTSMDLEFPSPTSS